MEGALWGGKAAVLEQIGCFVHCAEAEGIMSRDPSQPIESTEVNVNKLLW